ncbi:MAG: hypothetical protein KME30_07275 [Iphinoe sp. HA4291-MV1]|nr:hypothetical protein [Iphinoe sp. HA4291-MV1]
MVETGFLCVSPEQKSAERRHDNPKADIVVPVVARVPIAIRRAAVPRVVVPRAALRVSPAERLRQRQMPTEGNPPAALVSPRSSWNCPPHCRD